MNISKDNTVIVFDLHGVIFTFDYKKIVNLIWHFNHKLAIITTLFHLGFIFRLLKMLWNSATDEEFYDFFKQKRPILFPLIVAMTNAQKIIPGTAQIIEELACQGYTLHILSNIGPRRFSQLKADFPRLLSYFKEAKIVDSHAVDPRIKKPDPQFFQDYLNEYKKQCQNIIFIDDNKSNVAVTQSLGIISIRFRSAKQLRIDLEKIGLMI